MCSLGKAVPIHTSHASRLCFLYTLASAFRQSVMPWVSAFAARFSSTVVSRHSRKALAFARLVSLRAIPCARCAWTLRFFAKHTPSTHPLKAIKTFRWTIL